MIIFANDEAQETHRKIDKNGCGRNGVSSNELCCLISTNIKSSIRQLDKYISTLFDITFCV